MCKEPNDSKCGFKKCWSSDQQCVENKTVYILPSRQTIDNIVCEKSDIVWRRNPQNGENLPDFSVK